MDRSPTDADTVEVLRGEIATLKASIEYSDKNAATFGDQAIKATEKNYELWRKLVDSERQLAEFKKESARQLADCMKENKTNREKNPDTRDTPLPRLARGGGKGNLARARRRTPIGRRDRLTPIGRRRRTPIGRRRRTPIGRRRRTPIGRGRRRS